MARLIDADALLERLKGTPRYFDVKYDIEEMPVVTEAEIRNKTIDELLNRTEKNIDVFIGINGYLTGLDFRRILHGVVEQLKGSE